AEPDLARSSGAGAGRLRAFRDWSLTPIRGDARASGRAEGDELHRRFRRVAVDARVLPPEIRRERVEIRRRERAAADADGELVALTRVAHVDGALDRPRVRLDPLAREPRVDVALEIGERRV